MRLALLGLVAGVALTLPPLPAGAAKPDELRDAVSRSMAIIDKSQPVWSSQALCASCHHQSQPLGLAAAARSKGIAVNESVAAVRLATILKELEGRKDASATHTFMPGVHVVISSLLIGLAESKTPPNEVTDASVIYLLGKQSPEGNWRTAAVRFPNGTTDFFSTSTSIRAIDLYAPPSLRKDADARIARARTWLISTPATDETDALFHRLNGLVWSKAPRSEIAKAATMLAKAQQADGAWRQRPGLPTEAYTTGQSLLALAASGMKPTDPVYEAGVQYLLKTQAPDGSWHVAARALPIQPKIEGGFPYGVDQWISATATNVAGTALARAIP